MTTRIYKSTDISAPQLSYTSTTSNIIGVLKAVLVDGYGSMPGAGWAIEWESTNKISFLLGGVPGHSLVLDDSTSDESSCNVFACRSSTSVIDTDGKWPTLTDPTWVAPCYSAGAADKAWIIIASDTHFYYFNNNQSAGSFNCHWFFGEYETSIPALNGKNVALTVYSTIADNSDNYTTATDLLTNISSSPSWKYVYSEWDGNYNDTNNIRWFSTNLEQFYYGLPYDPLDGTVKYTPLMVNSYQDGVHMGQLPGAHLLVVKNSLSTNYTFDVAPGVLNNTRSMLGIRSHGTYNYSGTILVEYDE